MRGVIRKRMMKEKTLVCVAEKFIVGGVETYYMRMFRWAHAQRYRTVLLLPENAPIAEEWKSDIEKEKVEVLFYTSSIIFVKILNSAKKRIHFNEDDFAETTVVCDNLHTYVAASYIAQKYKWKNVSILLYVLHPEMSRCSEKKIFNFGYRYLFIKQNIKNGLIFMDEQTVKSFENYYGYEIDMKNAILRLGQEIPTHFEIKDRNKNKFSILSICRMDFPFKGYVLGLIDSCKKLKMEYPGIELVLIGDGSQYNRVLNRITELKLEQDIHLLKAIPYEEIDQYIVDSDLCVGMGTSLLDAGKHGKIGIIATANQYLPFSYGYFFDNPDKVAVFAGEEGWDRYCFEELIKNILECDDDKFYSWCQQSYDAVKEHYDICNIMDKLMNIKTHKLSSGIVMCLKIYDKLILELKKLAGIG